MPSQTFTASGTWAVPSSAAPGSVAVYAWGEGGAGSFVSNAHYGGAGGGGGGFGGETSLGGLTPGTTVLAITIGGGGTGTNTTVTGGSVTVTGNAGGSASGIAAGAAGAASGNTIAFAGGTGGTGLAGTSGQRGGAGGGGSGGSTGNGGAGGNAAVSASGAGGTAGTGAAGPPSLTGAAGGTGGAAGGGTGGAGTAPGAGGGGGGGAQAGGAAAAGQVIITWITVTTLAGTGTLATVSSLSAIAALPGAGRLTASATFPAGSTLSATALLSTAAVLSPVTTLAGTGSISGTGNPGSNLFGAGTLTAGVASQATGAITGAGMLSAASILAFPGAATLTGTASLTGSGITGYGVALPGTGVLVSVAKVLGATAGMAKVTAKPQAWPGSSQVAVSPPGSSRLYWLGTLGQVTALTYAFTCPGGCDKMTATLMVPATYRTQLFDPGWTVSIFRGGHQVWNGKLDEPAPVAGQGWSLTATGAGNLGQNFRAVYTSTWPANQPDESINGAISRGMPWYNPTIGQPAGSWWGQQIDSGADAISDLLTLMCSRGGLLWYVSSQPGGVPGANNLSVFPLPTTPSRLLVSATPAARTLGGDINTIWLRYEVTADNSTTGAAATYAVTSVTNAASVAQYGATEAFVDLSDAAVLTLAQVQAVGNYILGVYQRASYAGPFAAHYGDLMTMGGQPVDPGTDQAGTMVQLILADFAYGGEVSPQNPVQFIVGAYEWDDFAQVATITPYQVLDQSMSGLLQLETTLLAPITASST
jgi:hypothetical protein